MRLAYILHPPKVEMIEGFQQGFFFQWKGLATFYTAHPSLYIGLSTILFIVFAVYFHVKVLFQVLHLCCTALFCQAIAFFRQFLLPIFLFF